MKGCRSCDPLRGNFHLHSELPTGNRFLVNDIIKSQSILQYTQMLMNIDTATDNDKLLFTVFVFFQVSHAGFRLQGCLVVKLGLKMCFHYICRLF